MRIAGKLSCETPFSRRFIRIFPANRRRGHRKTTFTRGDAEIIPYTIEVFRISALLSINFLYTQKMMWSFKQNG